MFTCVITLSSRFPTGTHQKPLKRKKRNMRRNKRNMRRKKTKNDEIERAQEWIEFMNRVSVG